MDRIEEAGFRSVFEPQAIVRWHMRRTFGSTYKRFVVYARNNIRAGLWRQWQAVILSRYLMLIALAVVLLLVAPALVWLPIALWLLMLIVRAIVSIRRNRACYPASLVRNLKRLFLIVPLVATVDLAAIVGSVEWLVLDSFRGPRKTALEAGNGA